MCDLVDECVVAAIFDHVVIAVQLKLGHDQVLRYEVRIDDVRALAHRYCLRKVCLRHVVVHVGILW